MSRNNLPDTKVANDFSAAGEPTNFTAHSNSGKAM